MLRRPKAAEWVWALSVANLVLHLVDGVDGLF